MTNKTPMTNAEKQAARNDVLNQVARAAGWKGWSEFSTAVINGNVKISPKPQKMKIQPKEKAEK